MNLSPEQIGFLLILATLLLVALSWALVSFIRGCRDAADEFNLLVWMALGAEEER